jgi:oxygen-independent coproporphyrinogen-3 oxidase
LRRESGEPRRPEHESGRSEISRRRNSLKTTAAPWKISAPPVSITFPSIGYSPWTAATPPHAGIPGPVYSQHVSAYILSVEDGTVLQGLVRGGKFTPPDDDEAIRQYREAVDFLAGAGYERYEVSNFARGEGFRGRHNSNYWDYGEYLGAGMAAAEFRISGTGSETFARRRTNSPEFAKYLTGTGAYYDDIDVAMAKREFVMLCLRKLEGFAASDYERSSARGVFSYAGNGRPAEAERLLISKAGC